MSEITSRLRTALGNRYRLERRLGEGGMATVYLAEDLKHQRKVAVKVLRPELAAVLGAERFVQEITTTASLQHPNILPLFDSGESDGFLYYVMPYIDGETLRDKLNREKQLGIDEAVKIAAEAAEALDSAHRQGVIHRDIKPENILLYDGRPMVADFGIALAVSAAAGGRMTETGLSLGTPHYMSPEQATAEKDITARSDVYSLSAVLYEMLTGEPPHMGTTAQQIIMKIVTDQPRPVTELRKTVPPNVVATVTKALEKLAADRFDSAASFAAALNDPSFTVSTAAPVMQETRASVRTWRRTAVGSLCLSGILAGMLGWQVLISSAAPAGTVRVSMRFPAGERPTSVDANPRMALSPDGSVLVYVADRNAVGLRMRPLNALHATPIRGAEYGYAPVFAPDGKSIAYHQAPNASLHVIGVAGGPSLTLADSAWYSRPSWGDDDYVYFVNSAWGLSRVPAVGGPVEVLTAPDSSAGESMHNWPWVIPGAGAVLFTIARRPRHDVTRYDLAILDVGTREWHVLARGTSAVYAETGHLVFLTADGVLMAAPFDRDHLRLRGAAVPIQEGMLVKRFGAPDFALSENGTLVYATGGRAQEFVWVDRRGNEEPLGEDWISTTFVSPAISPDGRWLAAGAGDPAQVWTKPLPTGPAAKLTLENCLAYRPSWHPGGRDLSYISECAGEAVAWFSSADGAGLATELLAHESGVEQMVWSPDGKWLVYRVGGAEGQRDILAVRPDVDSVPRLLLDSPFDEHSPTLSPDGRWLAYVSTESGIAEVFVRPFPDVSAGKWLISAGGGSEPQWAHSGTELFFRSDAGDMMAAEVTTVPGFEVGARHMLYRGSTYESATYHAEYAVDVDDRRFLMIKAKASDSDELVLVLGWLTDALDALPAR